MSLGECLGWLAAALTLSAFSMRSMIALRLLGLGANVAFIAYGVIAALTPVLALHLVLLPCNIIRLWQLLPGLEDNAQGRLHVPICCDLHFFKAPHPSSTRAADRDWLIVEQAVGSVAAKSRRKHSASGRQWFALRALK